MSNPSLAASSSLPSAKPIVSHTLVIIPHMPTTAVLTSSLDSSSFATSEALLRVFFVIGCEASSSSLLLPSWVVAGSGGKLVGRVGFEGVVGSCYGRFRNRVEGSAVAMAQESWKRDTEETNCQAPEGPVMCTSNCGFFGSAGTLGMCSKCYGDFVLKQARASSAKSAAAEKAAAAAAAVCVPEFHAERDGDPLGRAQSENSYMAVQMPNEQSESGGSSSEAVPAAAASASGQEPTRQQPYRCFGCKKRVGLTGFKCRCGNTFCSLHRYSDKHSCSYDYKTAGRDAIAKANPVVKALKVDKI